MHDNSSFHEVRFPEDIALKASGGPERKTEIITMVSGHEVRNSRWADSRRKYNAGYGIKSLVDLQKVLAFFEERRGRLYGFRWLDRADFTSGNSDKPSPFDQFIASGDSIKTQFQLIKTYGSDYAPYTRPITKPVAASVMVAINNSSVTDGFSVDSASGVIHFSKPPAKASRITAGFMFDVPVRFASDFLEISISSFIAGEIPNIPLIEIK